MKLTKLEMGYPGQGIPSDGLPCIPSCLKKPWEYTYRYSHVFPRIHVFPLVFPRPIYRLEKTIFSDSLSYISQVFPLGIPSAADDFAGQTVFPWEYVGIHVFPGIWEYMGILYGKGLRVVVVLFFCFFTKHLKL